MGVYGLETRFSDDQAITGDAASTNVLRVGPGDFGQGNDLYLDVYVTEAFNTLTSLNIALQTDDNSGFTSATTLYSAEVVLANLTLGAKIPLKAIPNGCEEYIRLNYTVTGTDPTTGKIFASLTDTTQDSDPSF